jgi:hypothetical protein
MDPLTPMDKMKLEALLKKAAAGAPISELAAERERKLKAEQENLIRREREAAAPLTRLQLKLDRTTTHLNFLINQRLRSDRNFYLRANRDVRRVLNRYVENVRAALPTADNPERLIEAIQILLEANFPELAEAAPSLAEQMAAFNAVSEENLEQDREQTARAIINAGRQRRNEPPLPDNVALFNPRKDFKT